MCEDFEDLYECYVKGRGRSSCCVCVFRTFLIFGFVFIGVAFAGVTIMGRMSVLILTGGMYWMSLCELGVLVTELSVTILFGVACVYFQGRRGVMFLVSVSV